MLQDRTVTFHTAPILMDWFGPCLKLKNRGGAHHDFRICI